MTTSSSLARLPLRVKAVPAGLLVLAVAGGVLSGPVVPHRARLASTSVVATAPGTVLSTTSSTAAFAAGKLEGVAVSAGSITFGRAAGTTPEAGGTWAFTRWTSPWTTPAGTFTQLVPSWDAVTPAGTSVRVVARLRSTTGATSGWKQVADWSTRDTDGFRRTSGATQRDAVAGLATDTLTATSGSLASFQLRVLLLRAPGATATPRVDAVRAVSSRSSGTVAPTTRGSAARELTVPRYSQMTHRGEYPQYGGGGQAWCSPTSLSMILGYWGRLPNASNYAWVDPRDSDRWVDHVARVVYDNGYHGAGNWAFNTAYAAVLVGDAFVTRLGDLREVERFIAAGIPLAASISFARGQLSGAPIGATDGHLVVVTGFTAAGNVVVNDPAAPSDASVRRVYDRAQFERAWARSQGTVYVVHDPAHPLPPRGASRAW
ncbi:MAG: peptidase family protein [Marmoricola sp.]|nr:peptidase family protein [Marmoricola sp.]